MLEPVPALAPRDIPEVLAALTAGPSRKDRPPFQQMALSLAGLAGRVGPRPGEGPEDREGVQALRRWASQNLFWVLRLARSSDPRGAPRRRLGP